MANQGYDRRMMLQLVAKAAVASQFPGFSKWVFGAQEHDAHQHAVSAARAHQTYHPTYFNASEYRTIEILTDLIIPADETPGAKAAGVCEFIDFMAAHGEREVQQPMRKGLAGLDATAKKSHQAAFERLTSEQQIELLRTVASKKGTDAEGQAFFSLIRQYTVMGYYTSRIGLEELDFPGLRLYTTSPACLHTDDPEHLHLRSARI